MDVMSQNLGEYYPSGLEIYRQNYYHPQKEVKIVS